MRRAAFFLRGVRSPSPVVVVPVAGPISSTFKPTHAASLA